MEIVKRKVILKESIQIQSKSLEREVLVDVYYPGYSFPPESLSLLLINDGQDMEKLGLEGILEDLFEKNSLHPLLCVGIHAGRDRKQEYGTSATPDYKGRGARASDYNFFVFNELIPFIRSNYFTGDFKQKAIAGFSLGGLSALDIAWSHPHEFSRVGIFSGSLWWRNKEKTDKTYNDATDRIMHQEIRKAGYYPWLKFFFECGAADEEDDRNSNGVIDSIDDTLDLIQELVAKGYQEKEDIHYLQLADGKHDIATWARAMPEFLKWGWGVGAY